MERGELTLLFVALYFVIGGVIAYASRRKYSGELGEFYTAPKRFGWFFSSLTYAATTYSAFMIIGLVGLSYSTGVGALGFELTYLTSTVLILGLFSYGVWRRSSQRGWLTPSRMLGDIYGSRKLEITVAILYLLALTPYMAAQIQGIASALKPVGIDYPLGVALAITAALAWTMAAGMWSIVYTDVFQGVWMIIASTLLLAWLIHKSAMVSGISFAMQRLGEAGLFYVGKGFWTPIVFVSFTLPWIFFSVTNPQVVHRLYIPRREKDLKLMIVSFTIYGLIYTVMMFFIGVLSRALTFSGTLPLIKNRDMVTPLVLGLSPPLIQAFVFTSVLAASISTIDSILHSISSSFTSTLSHQYRLRGGLEKRIAYATIVSLMLLVALISAYRIAFVVELSVLSSLFLLPLAPLTLYGWARQTPPKASLSSIASLLTGLGIEACALAYTLIKGLPLKHMLVMSPLGVPLSLWILVASTAVLLTLSHGRR